MTKPFIQSFLDVIQHTEGGLADSKSRF